jgi:transcriptional regulator with XRE-family HTH domain
MGSRQPNATDAHIGQRLRILRIAKGMSQSEVASGLGITFQQIQKYENGRNRIGAGRLQELANLFGVSATFFFQEGPHIKTKELSQPSTTEMLTRKDSFALVKAFNRIRNRAIRHHVVDLVERLANSY